MYVDGYDSGDRNSLCCTLTAATIIMRTVFLYIYVNTSDSGDMNYHLYCSVTVATVIIVTLFSIPLQL